MKLDPENELKFEILFNFDLNALEDTKQTEFLYSYYIAKLRLLRNNNYSPYITRDQDDQESFYKDMISATACYLQSLKKLSLKQLKKKQNERNNQESGSLP